MVAQRKRSGLGRGLSALLGDDINMSEMASKVAEAAKQDVVAEIDVDRIQAGKYQPRTEMDEIRLQELADSIRVQGLINPILLREISDGRYEIVAGERRYRASVLAGKKTVSAFVRKLDDKTTLALGLIENMQRQDLNVVEEALGVKRLIDEFEFTHDEAARVLGLSRSGTTNLLRILNLAEPVRKMLSDGEIQLGHAKVIMALGKAQQIMLAQEVVARDMSVRETEKRVKDFLADDFGKEKPAKSKNDRQRSRDEINYEESLSEMFGTPVHLKISARGKGRLVIDFADLDALEAIVSKVSQK